MAEEVRPGVRSQVGLIAESYFSALRRPAAEEKRRRGTVTRQAICGLIAATQPQQLPTQFPI
jgi:hypothetical protein